MLPEFESFMDATPEKGVIMVEYYWQPRPGTSPSPGDQDECLGFKTSTAFFKRIRTTDKCWCGSNRQFGHCHRRADDWTYVTLDPEQQSYSPVVLLDQVLVPSDYSEMRRRLDTAQGLLPIENTDGRAVFALSAQPMIENEIGALMLGTATLTPDALHLETNSEKRLSHLRDRLLTLSGQSMEAGPIRRIEPQRAFPAPRARRKAQTYRRAEAR